MVKYVWQRLESMAIHSWSVTRSLVKHLLWTLHFEVVREHQ